MKNQTSNDLHFDLWKYFRPAIYLWGVKDIYYITCMLKLVKTIQYENNGIIK